MVIVGGGSRHHSDIQACYYSLELMREDPIAHELERQPDVQVFAHGGNGYRHDGAPLWGQPDCFAVRGADMLAGQAARELGFSVYRVWPDWSVGPSAGPKRNTRMLERWDPDFVMLWNDNLAGSRGSYDLAEKALQRGTPIYWVQHVSVQHPEHGFHHVWLRGLEQLPPPAFARH